MATVCIAWRSGDLAWQSSERGDTLGACSGSLELYGLACVEIEYDNHGSCRYGNNAILLAMLCLQSYLPLQVLGKQVLFQVTELPLSQSVSVQYIVHHGNL